MTYEEIFSQTRELILANEIKGHSGHLAVQVNIIGEGEGIFYIEVNDNNVNIEPYEYYDRDCALIISGSDFLKICSGKLGAIKAFTVGKLKIDGSVDKALEFSKLVDQVIKAKAVSNK